MKMDTSMWGFIRIVQGIQSNRLGLRERVRGNFEARQGTQRILGYKLLIDRLMDPSGGFCHEQSSHLSELESPGRRGLLMKTVRCGVGGFCPPLLPTLVSLETQRIHSLSLDFSNSSQRALPQLPLPPSRIPWGFGRWAFACPPWVKLA